MRIIRIIKRSVSVFFLLLGTLVLANCTPNRERVMFSEADMDSAAVAVENYLEFPQYGFSIESHCELKDVSPQVSGDFLLNYGGITDGNDPDKMTAYQLIVSRVPVGYRDLPRKQYEQMVDSVLRAQAQKFKSYKAIKVGYEEYSGYAVETTKDEYGQKGIMFVKDNLIIALTVISNDNLEAKFNKFTNGFKTLVTEDKPLVVEAEEPSGLDKQYSNAYFSLCYPSSWQIVQDGNQATANTSIAVQIMEKRKNDIDFRPNINIIVSNRKWEESTSSIARQVAQNNKQMVPSYKHLGISDTSISGCSGSLLEGTIEFQGYTLRSNQFIVKKPDNTTFTITATTDNGKHREQMKIINQILKSIRIK